MTILEFYKSARPSLRARGALVAGLGFLGLVWPDQALVAVVALIAMLIAIDGLSLLLQARSGSGRVRAFTVIQGVASLLVGIVVLATIGDPAIETRFALAAWSLLGGVIEVVLAAREKRDEDLAGLLGVSGLLALVMGALLIGLSDTDFAVLIGLFGAYQLGRGIVLISAAVMSDQAEVEGRLSDPAAETD